MTIDISNYVRRYPEANTAEKQEWNFFFSEQTKKDLCFLRAFLVATHKAWIPISNPETYLPVNLDCVIHCDASGAVNTDPGQPGPALGVYIPTQQGIRSRAVSFPLPLAFLRAEDGKSANYHHTTFLEGKI